MSKVDHKPTQNERIIAYIKEFGPADLADFSGGGAVLHHRLRRHGYDCRLR